MTGQTATATTATQTFATWEGLLTIHPNPSFRLTLTGGLHADEAGLPGVLTESGLAIWRVAACDAQAG